MKTLLERAKTVKSRYISKQEFKREEGIELAFAWLRGELTNKQVVFAFNGNPKSGSQLYKICLFLKEAYRDGKLKII